MDDLGTIICKNAVPAFRIIVEAIKAAEKSTEKK